MMSVIELLLVGFMLSGLLAATLVGLLRVRRAVVDHTHDRYILLNLIFSPLGPGERRLLFPCDPASVDTLVSAKKRMTGTWIAVWLVWCVAQFGLSSLGK